MKINILKSVSLIAAVNIIGAPQAKSGSHDSFGLNPQVEWSLELSGQPSDLVTDQNEHDLVERQKALASVARSIESSGVAVTLKPKALSASGVSSLSQLRRILFDKQKNSINIIGGPSEVEIIRKNIGLPMDLELQANPSTGYTWQQVDDFGFPINAISSKSPITPGVGAPVVQRFHGVKEGRYAKSLRFSYRRLTEYRRPALSKLTIKLVDDRRLSLYDPTPSRLLLRSFNKKVLNQANPSIYSELTERAVSYDSRLLNIVTPVRDQGGCGSCWSFGTVGAMEVALAKSGATNNSVDLSEQFLISCNKDGWSCNGGLTASKYHFDTLATSQVVAGAVLESDKPYTQTNGTCPVQLPHPYKGSSWSFLTGSEWNMPTNDQIKSAIVAYGSVTAGVCVDDGWYNYTGGVYAPQKNGCLWQGLPSTNHQIVLVGWDDGTQSWILRNSWGASWGENGYMRIKYDPNGTSSRVGEGASWIAITSTKFALRVTKTGDGSGTVTSSPSGISCGSTCTASFAANSTVTLIAKPTPESTFSSWSGCASVNGASCTVSLTEAKNITANFAQSSNVSGLFSAILPTARSVKVAQPATAFGTIVNATGVPVTGCYLALPNNPSIPAALGYQTTNASNVLIGSPNTPIDIPAGGSQNFLFGITPTTAFGATNIPIVFDCSNTNPAPSQTGLNTFLLSASNTPSPDMVAIGSTTSNDGVLRIPSPTGIHAFGAAAVNIGTGGVITAMADTGGVNLPLTLTICRTNPSTGGCYAAPSSSVSSTINIQQSVTYAVFAKANGPVPFDPAVNRVFLRLSSGGVVRGATSVAIMTSSGG